MGKSKSMKKNQKCKIGLLAFSLSFFVPFFANAIDQGAGKVTANVTQASVLLKAWFPMSRENR